MRNVSKAWNAIRTQACHANPPLLEKMAPEMLGYFGAKNEQLSDYYGHKKTWAWTQFGAKLFQILNQIISNVYGTCEGNATCHCYPMTSISLQ